MDKKKAAEQRDLIVAKSNEMLQNARFDLSVLEQRVILYAAAQIMPDDDYLKEYVFEISDFYKMIGWSNESYTEFKLMLKKLADKSWWLPMLDKNGKPCESLVRWFTTVRPNKRSGTVVIKFHEDMFPHLIQLAKQYRLTGKYYTQYTLKYILAMKSKFSIRLYELLKSYQQNNKKWNFDIDNLKELLCDRNGKGEAVIPKSWNNFAEFERSVLVPACEEINRYTDIQTAYAAEKIGRKYTFVQFGFYTKPIMKRLEAEKAIEKELDGDPEQMTMDEFLGASKEVEINPVDALFREEAELVKAEREAAEKAKKSKR